MTSRSRNGRTTSRARTFFSVMEEIEILPPRRPARFSWAVATKAAQGLMVAGLVCLVAWPERHIWHDFVGRNPGNQWRSLNVCRHESLPEIAIRIGCPASKLFVRNEVEVDRRVSHQHHGPPVRPRVLTRCAALPRSAPGLPSAVGLAARAGRLRRWL